MRFFFATIGVLAWIWALAVLWIFKESGGALTMIAAGVFSTVAVLSLGCERILKTLEDIRDGVGAEPRGLATDRERERASARSTTAPAV